MTFYRMGWLIVAVISFIFTFTDHVRILGGCGTPFWLFYTSWSVWFACAVSIVCFASSFVSYVKNENTFPFSFGYIYAFFSLVKFCVTVGIVATFVAGIVIASSCFSGGLKIGTGDLFKHFLLPVMTVADEFLFPPRIEIKRQFPVFAMIAPILYWAVIVRRIVVFRSLSGGSIPLLIRANYYPYPFTDMEAGHTLSDIILTLFFMLVLLFFVAYSFRLCINAKIKSQKSPIRQKNKRILTNV